MGTKRSFCLAKGEEMIRALCLCPSSALLLLLPSQHHPTCRDQSLEVAPASWAPAGGWARRGHGVCLCPGGRHSWEGDSQQPGC